MAQFDLEAVPQISESKIQALQLQSTIQDLQRFEQENKVQHLPNHKTGFLEATHVNKHDFARERLDFDIAHAKDESKPVLSKRKRKILLKAQREAQGDAASDNFMGPWAVYSEMKGHGDQDDEGRELTPEE